MIRTMNIHFYDDPYNDGSNEILTEVDTRLDWEEIFELVPIKIDWQQNSLFLVKIPFTAHAPDPPPSINNTPTEKEHDFTSFFKISNNFYPRKKISSKSLAYVEIVTGGRL